MHEDGKMRRRARTTIGKAALAAQVSVETVRFYERKGLIQQPDAPIEGGPRHYPAETVRKLQFIRQAQEVGFSLSEIAELLELRTDPKAQCDDVRERTLAKIETIDEKIARLKSMRSVLSALAETCPRKGAAAQNCTILQAFDRTD